jgi:hypothetical protein
MKIEVFSRLTLSGRRWFFRIKAANGKIVAQSESYHNRSDAIETATMLRAKLFDATLEYR